MKKNFLNKIIDIKEISNKEKLALAITLLVILVVLVNIVYSLNVEENPIDYKSFDIISMIDISETVYDRQTYWDLSGIVSKFIYSYNLEIDTLNSKIDYDKIDYRIEDYYLTLSSEYKKSISKQEFLERSKRICKNFIKKDEYGEYISLKSDVIKDIYLLPERTYGNGLYLCKLNTNITNTYSYIGIALNQDSKTFNIFFLE